MAKYHINPLIGVPGLCSATNNRCPYGGPSDHYDSPQAAVQGLEKKLIEQERLASVPTPKVKKPKAPSRSDYAKNTGHNSDSSMIAYALQGPGRNKPMDNMSGMMDKNRINPQSGEGDVHAKFDNGAVILGKADGSRLRVLAGNDEIYSDPGAEMGRGVRLTKMRQSSGDGHIDLHVLGYVDQDGNRFGYVPDKKIHYFVDV